MAQIGNVFYDEFNGRYITVDGVGTDPNVYACVVEEFNDNGDIEVVGRQLFTAGELAHFELLH